MTDHIRVQITTTTIIVGGGFGIGGGYGGVLVIIIVVHDYRYSFYKTSINLYQTLSYSSFQKPASATMASFSVIAMSVPFLYAVFQ